MPLTALTPEQKIFLDNYIHQHSIKGRSMKKRAESFSDLRQQIVALLPRVPATGPTAKAADRLETIDKAAARGEFKAAREAARTLLAAMQERVATYDADPDLVALNTMVTQFVASASEAADAVAALRTQLQQLDAPSRPIPAAALPTAARGTDAWQRAAGPLLMARNPDAQTLEQGIAASRRLIDKIDSFLGSAYSHGVFGIDKQTVLAAQIKRGDTSPETRDLVDSQTGRIRAQAFTVLCQGGQPGQFMSEKAFRAPQDAAVRALDARLDVLKNQLAGLTAEAGFGDVPQGSPGLNVPKEIARRDGVVEPPRRGIDRVARQREMLVRMQERQRLMNRRGGDIAALQAEQRADQQALAALQAQPGGLRQHAAPPRPYDMAALGAVLPSPVGDTLQGGSPDTSFEPDARQLALLAQQASTAVMNQLTAHGPIDATSDEFFDLTLQSADDVAAAYCQAKGWTGPTLTAGRRKVAQAVGRAVQARVVKANAERVAGDGTPIGNAIDLAQGRVKIDGQDFANPKELARGGFGVVTRYESLAQPGTFVVVKSTIRGADPGPDADPLERQGYEEEVAERRAAMKQEVISHRHLAKAAAASNAEGRANVVDMKGAMAAEDGSLHMVLELVEGGDLDDNRFAMNVAANSGALPEEARNVLNQFRLRQAAQGMKFMRDQDMVHFDIKGANFMVAADGTLKVGDFGSAGVSQTGDGKVVAGAHNPGTSGYMPGRAAEGATVDNAYDTFALGKVLQVAHLNVTNPLQPAWQSDLPPEFENLTGALGRVSGAMTGATPDERPQLEQVLESSYLKNLDNFDPAVIQELSATAVDYAKALKAEAATVRAQVPRADLERWAEGKSPDELNFTDMNAAMQEEIRRANVKALELRTALEAMPPAPVVPQGAVSGVQRMQAALDKHVAEKTRIEAALAAQLQIVKDKQALLAKFGQSDGAKALGAKLREISDRLLRPSAASPGDEPAPLDGAEVTRLMDSFKQRLTALSPAITRAKRSGVVPLDEIARLTSEAGTLARRHRFDDANRMLDGLEARIG